ncbi:hypothetical protein ACQUEF_01615 [Vagococcus fluvialis]|uniref:hypothetical protein n=1 Tax=Vagococcus fluvialis TaxID=2738 RepID=UPI003D0E5567
MNTFSDTLTFYDLQKLPRLILSEIIETCGYNPKDYTKDSMIDTIWGEVQNRDNDKRELFEPYELSLFSNRCSMTWFRAATLRGLKQLIVEQNGEQVIDGQLEIGEEQIVPAPKLFSIADCPENIGDNCFIARFLYQDGYYYIPTIEGNQRLKKVRTLTALIDETHGIIEVRGSKTLSEKVVQVLAAYFDDNPQIQQFAILGNHESNSDQLAATLDGQLIESIGEPNLPLEDLNEEQVEAVVSILNVVDKGLVGKEEIQLDYSGVIQESRDVLFTDSDPVPFLALVLAGLNKVSLSTLYSSLISSPLYQSLTPHLIDNGGYIRFNSDFLGLIVENTIQVARIANSIVLKSNSNEYAIKKIREAVFLIEVVD